MTLRSQPVRIATGSADQESRLVFRDGFPVAVLVRLSDEYEHDAGQWVLEAGFGRMDDPSAPFFAELTEAEGWILGRLGVAVRGP